MNIRHVLASGLRQEPEVLTGTVGLFAAGVGIGLVAERRLVGRQRLRPDPQAGEPFGRLPGRPHTVPAEDGVPLYLEEVGATDAPLTLVFCHGYCENMTIWHYQRRDLADSGARLIFPDQRAHGRSGRGERTRATIDQLGRDLDAILAAVVPTGPVVLVGHSMGGMTIMALAEQRPELFGDRVVGVGLVSTSTGKLAEVTFGIPAVFSRFSRRTLPVLTSTMSRRPELVERTRRVGTDLAFLLTRQLTFGSRDVSPAVVEMIEKMIAATPVDVIADFYPGFSGYDKLAALTVLDPVEVVILVGTNDALTPVGHSRAMADALPNARLVVLPDAGHMLPVEHPSNVTAELAGLLERVGTVGRSTATSE
jgi:pimeloyl-ACP methyl ester carboxylesterase